MDPFAIHRILHPTDFSAPADAALGVALDLAVRTGADLHVLHVAPADVDYREEADGLALHEEEEQMEEMGEAVETQLEALSGEAEGAPHVAYGLAESRYAALGIAEYARRHGMNAIVMGTHGRRGLRHLLLGSVADEVLRTAPCSVMTVRRQKEGVMDVDHVLVPVDFSDLSGPALEQAKHLAARYDARLTLFFVAEEHVVPFFSDTGIPSFTLKKIDPDIIDHAEEALRELDADTPGPDVPTTYVVEDGQPVDEIVDYAKGEGARLIVMATHGLSSEHHSFLGSVTERVVRAAPCPVWTVNPTAADQQ